METSTQNPFSLPSGYEVESASLHMPVEGGLDVVRDSSAPAPRGLRARIEHLKPMMTERVDTVRTQLRRVPAKLQSVKPMMAERVDTLRTQLRGMPSKLQSSMRSNTMMWAGIATAAGFGAGLWGRIARHRMAHRRGAIPAVVIIDAC